MKPRVYLTTKDRFTFYNFVQEWYAVAKLNDVDFADMVKERTGLTVNADHVSRARADFGIPNNSPRPPRPEPPPADAISVAVDGLAALELRVSAIEDWVESQLLGTRLRPVKTS